MSYCPSAGNIEWCYALGALPVIAAIQFGLVAYKVLKRPSFIDQIMDTEEFGENQTLIERSRLVTNLKVAASLLNAVICLTYIIMFAVIPEEFTFVMPTFMAVQGLNWIGCAWLARKDYNKQGRSSIALLMSLLFNCVAQSISGVITLVLQDEEENILNKQELSAVVLLEATSILTLILFIVKRTDFTSEALLLQAHLFSTENRQTAITASLLKNDEEKQADYLKINPSFKSAGSPIQDNLTPTNNVNTNLSLDQNQNQCSSQATSFLSQQTFTPKGSLTLSRNPSEKIFKGEENENPIKHVQVIGYKAKNEQMIFVISYKKNGREYRTERSHRDFKYLATLLSEELKETRLSLPQLPKRIKETGELDKAVLNEKKLRYNRFFFYLDYNQIKSKSFDEFLLPITQKPFFKPVEATLSDAQSSCSENDTCDVSQDLNASNYNNSMIPQNRNLRVNSISVVKQSQKTVNQQQSANRQRSSTLKVSS